MATPLVQTPLHKKNGDWYRKKICGVYLITNTSNGMHYCGQSVDISARWQQHLTPNKSAIGTAIAEAPQRFTFRILERCPKELLNEREKFYIALYNCVHPLGYNKTSGGSSGSVVSAETKAKMSESKKGKTISEEHRRKIGEATKGKIISEEQKQKISKANKTPSEETRRKMSEASKNRSEETRLKLSTAKKEYWAQIKLLKSRSPEYILVVDSTI